VVTRTCGIINSMLRDVNIAMLVVRGSGRGAGGGGGVMGSEFDMGTICLFLEQAACRKLAYFRGGSNRQAITLWYQGSC
jgi:hypothetical protein